MILLVCDGEVWHKSQRLEIPENIKIIHIHPYTPEMNLIEQIWKQIRAMRFRNEAFKTINDVVNRLCKTINLLSKNMVKSITHRDWLSV